MGLRGTTDAKDLLRNAEKAAQQIAREVKREQFRYSFLCRIGWHAWTQWRTIGKGTELSPVNRQVVGFYTQHERRCQRCNCPDEKIIHTS